MVPISRQNQPNKYLLALAPRRNLVLQHQNRIANHYTVQTLEQVLNPCQAQAVALVEAAVAQTVAREGVTETETETGGAIGNALVLALQYRVVVRMSVVATLTDAVSERTRTRRAGMVIKSINTIGTPESVSVTLIGLLSAVEDALATGNTLPATLTIGHWRLGWAYIENPGLAW